MKKLRKDSLELTIYLYDPLVISYVMKIFEVINILHGLLLLH